MVKTFILSSFLFVDFFELQLEARVLDYSGMVSRMAIRSAIVGGGDRPKGVTFWVKSQLLGAEIGNSLKFSRIRRQIF